jgi:hypothetical protein
MLDEFERERRVARGLAETPLEVGHDVVIAR